MMLCRWRSHWLLSTESMMISTSTQARGSGRVASWYQRHDICFTQVHGSLPVGASYLPPRCANTDVAASSVVASPHGCTPLSGAFRVVWAESGVRDLFQVAAFARAGETSSADIPVSSAACQLCAGGGEDEQSASLSRFPVFWMRVIGRVSPRPNILLSCPVGLYSIQSSLHLLRWHQPAARCFFGVILGFRASLRNCPV